MSLKETLLQDMKEAMKEKNTIRKNTIQLVRSGVLQIEKDKQIEMDDEGVFDIIVKELKKRRDSLPDFEKSGRTDLIEDLKKEIDILVAYLPEQLSDEDVEKIIKEAIQEIGAVTMKDMGKVMSAVTPKLKGRADNKKVSELVKQNLK
jgi:uncharacterized protein YqeY